MVKEITVKPYLTCPYHQGANGSTLERLEQLPEDERYNGLTNVCQNNNNNNNIIIIILYQFGNTCYANSVLQALYFCLPFREKVLKYSRGEGEDETLLSALSDLFSQMSNTKKKFGVVAPRRFILRVKKENGKREGGIEATEQSISQTSGRNTTFERS